MKRFIAGVFFVACTLSLVGCGTMKGFGQDMQSGGQNIEATASK